MIIIRREMRYYLTSSKLYREKTAISGCIQNWQMMYLLLTARPDTSSSHTSRDTLGIGHPQSVILLIKRSEEIRIWFWSPWSAIKLEIDLSMTKIILSPAYLHILFTAWENKKVSIELSCQKMSNFDVCKVQIILINNSCSLK